MLESYVKFYGDRVRWFLGTVTNINDPIQLGRVQIRVYGIHNNIKDIKMSALPWAQIMVPVTEEGVGGLGANVGIKPGAQVFGYFMDGANSQHPIVLGSIPKIEKPNVVNEDKTEISRGGGADNVPKFLPSTFTDSTFLSGSTNEEKIWNYFRSDVGGSWTPIQTAALLGNFAIETNYQKFGTISPTVTQENGPGYGIAQWEGPRKDFFLNKFVSDPLIQLAYSGGPYLLEKTSLWSQLTYVNYEFTNTEKKAAKELRNATTIEEATDAVLNRYERPAGSRYSPFEGDPQRQARIDYAKDFFTKFTEGGG